VTRTVGISAFGVALPRTRIALRDIHEVWENSPWALIERAGVVERTVCEPDMDAITLAADAARNAMAMVHCDDVDAVFLGTQTGPYLSRASASVLVDVLGVGPDVFATDLQFAGKSGTAALLLAAAWVGSGFGECALAIGSDTLGVHAAPGDPTEYWAGSGAVAFLVDRETRVAVLERGTSYTSDTPDGYRLDGERYFHRGGSTMTVTDVGFPAHARGAWTRLGVNGEGVDRLAIQQPDAAQPKKIVALLGWSAGSSTG
jgi:hydroxymethylglutaryl-CoA synthase